MKVYTCLFFFNLGDFVAIETEVVIVIVIVIITLPLPQNTGNNKSQKLKNICSDCFADGLRRISREEGLVSLWSGTGPSLVLAGNPAIQFMVYEAIKKFLMEDNKKVCAVIPHKKMN